MKGPVLKTDNQYLAQGQLVPLTIDSIFFHTAIFLTDKNCLCGGFETNAAVLENLITFFIWPKLCFLFRSDKNSGCYGNF